MPTVQSKEELIYVIRTNITVKIGKQYDWNHFAQDFSNNIKVTSDGKKVFIHIPKKVFDNYNFKMNTKFIVEDYIKPTIYNTMEDEFCTDSFEIEDNFHLAGSYIALKFTLPDYISDYLVHGIWD